MRSFPIFIISMAIIFMVCPFLFYFGEFKYGDDFNLALSVQQLGIIGATANWLEHYGVVYRPLGVFLLFVNYSIVNAFGVSAGYAVQFFSIMTIFALLHRVLTSFGFSSRTASLATLVAMLFPLNASAYFQLSSLPMMFAILFWLTSVLALVSQPKKLFLSYSLSASFFVFSVLSYEQILPLVMVNLVVAVTRVQDLSVRFHSLSVFYSFLISAFCVLFLFFYFGNQTNPKVLTVKAENSKIEQKLSEDSGSVTTKEPLKADKLLMIKIRILAQKTIKTLNFIKGSLFEAFELVKKWTWFEKILFVIVPTLWPSWLLYKTFACNDAEGNVISVRQNIHLKFFLLGFGVLALPIAPFFIYHSVPITNYVFVIPSIGLSFLTAALLSAKPRYAVTLLLPIYLTMATAFLAYPSSLGSFLNYWYELAEHVNDNPLAQRSGYIEIELPERSYQHVFWLEKAFAKRLLTDLSKERIKNIEFRNDFVRLTF